MSNNTVSRRIAEMPDNILILKLQYSKLNFFAIQLDENTNGAKLVQLCSYVRYIHVKDLEDDCLVKALTRTQRQKTYFAKSTDYFEKHDQQRKQVIGVCTDGAPVMLGFRSTFPTLAKKIIKRHS